MANLVSKDQSTEKEVGEQQARFGNKMRLADEQDKIASSNRRFQRF